MDWNNIYKAKMMTVDGAAGLIESGDRVFIGGASCLPVELVDSISSRKDLDDVELIASDNITPCRLLTDSSCIGRIGYNTVFMGAADRAAVPFGNVKINTMHFHNAIRAARDVYKINVFMIQAPEPDEAGYISFGSEGIAWSHIADFADKIIFQINRFQPKAAGLHDKIHVSQVSGLCRCDHELFSYSFKECSDAERRIASYITKLIPDGSTLQVGLGGVSNAVALGLENKKNLRIYTEVLTDSLAYLLDRGCVDKDHVIAAFSQPTEGPLKYVASGIAKLAPLDQVNDPYNAGKNPQLISINACLMTDLTGQVCSESIGSRQYSSTGGQVDFVRAAQISEGGKSFLCMNSRHLEQDGSYSSNVKASLPLGAVVTTPRTDVMYVVTEWGIADLFCRPLEDRAIELIRIAHPDFREILLDEAVGSGLIRSHIAEKERASLLAGF